ncbi:hypothetical protein BLNAU_20745 [Blattamonas nauphoetae]|uniref:EF-hand domain-containing protein n=1 Tax=Blattamonas nauphoetae TaxID=2049346 RepID=A0ABQ9X156_9EUKA|nr:hypothetical protein BLNAU_20745 [Blattamonas nauphoetae]
MAYPPPYAHPGAPYNPNPYPQYYPQQQPMQPYVPNAQQMQQQLMAYYAGACSDGLIDVNEIINAAAMFHVQIDHRTAQQLLVDIAGPQRRITRQGFVDGMIQFVQARTGTAPLPVPSRPLPHTSQMYPQLQAFYAGAVSDGLIDVNEVITALRLFGINIDKYQARNLLVQIAGPQQRITQQSFCDGIIRYTQTLPPAPGYAPAPQASAPPPQLPGSYHSPPPQSQYPPPPQQSYPPPPLSNPSAPYQAHQQSPSAPSAHRQLSQQEQVKLHNLYAQASANGAMNSNEVVTICSHFGVRITPQEASSLLTQVAGQVGRITQDRFVLIIGDFLAQRRGF